MPANIFNDQPWDEFENQIKEMFSKTTMSFDDGETLAGFGSTITRMSSAGQQWLRVNLYQNASGDKDRERNLVMDLAPGPITNVRDEYSFRLLSAHKGSKWSRLFTNEIYQQGTDKDTISFKTARKALSGAAYGAFKQKSIYPKSPQSEFEKIVSEGNSELGLAGSLQSVSPLFTPSTVSNIARRVTIGINPSVDDKKTAMQSIMEELHYPAQSGLSPSTGMLPHEAMKTLVPFKDNLGLIRLRDAAPINSYIQIDKETGNVKFNLFGKPEKWIKRANVMDSTKEVLGHNYYQLIPGSGGKVEPAKPQRIVTGQEEGLVIPNVSLFGEEPEPLTMIRRLAVIPGSPDPGTTQFRPDYDPLEKQGIIGSFYPKAYEGAYLPNSVDQLRNMRFEWGLYEKKGDEYVAREKGPQALVNYLVPRNTSQIIGLKYTVDPNTKKPITDPNTGKTIYEEIRFDADDRDSIISGAPEIYIPSYYSKDQDRFVPTNTPDLYGQTVALNPNDFRKKFGSATVKALETQPVVSVRVPTGTASGQNLKTWGFKTSIVPNLIVPGNEDFYRMNVFGESTEINAVTSDIKSLLPQFGEVFVGGLSTSQQKKMFEYAFGTKKYGGLYSYLDEIAAEQGRGINTRFTWSEALERFKESGGSVAAETKDIYQFMNKTMGNLITKAQTQKYGSSIWKDLGFAVMKDNQYVPYKVVSGSVKDFEQHRARDEAELYLKNNPDLRKEGKTAESIVSDLYQFEAVGESINGVQFYNWKVNAPTILMTGGAEASVEHNYGRQPRLGYAGSSRLELGDEAAAMMGLSPEQPPGAVNQNTPALSAWGNLLSYVTYKGAQYDYYDVNPAGITTNISREQMSTLRAKMSLQSIELLKEGRGQGLLDMQKVLEEVIPEPKGLLRSEETGEIIPSPKTIYDASEVLTTESGEEYGRSAIYHRYHKAISPFLSGMPSSQPANSLYEELLNTISNSRNNEVLKELYSREVTGMGGHFTGQVGLPMQNWFVSHDDMMSLIKKVAIRDKLLPSGAEAQSNFLDKAYMMAVRQGGLWARAEASPVYANFKGGILTRVIDDLMLRGQYGVSFGESVRIMPGRARGGKTTLFGLMGSAPPTVEGIFRDFDLDPAVLSILGRMTKSGDMEYPKDKKFLDAVRSISADMDFAAESEETLQNVTGAKKGKIEGSGWAAAAKDAIYGMLDEKTRENFIKQTSALSGTDIKSSRKYSMGLLNVKRAMGETYNARRLLESAFNSTGIFTREEGDKVHSAFGKAYYKALEFPPDIAERQFEKFITTMRFGVEGGKAYPSPVITYRVGDESGTTPGLDFDYRDRAGSQSGGGSVLAQAMQEAVLNDIAQGVMNPKGAFAAFATSEKNFKSMSARYDARLKNIEDPTAEQELKLVESIIEKQRKSKDFQFSSTVGGRAALLNFAGAITGYYKGLPYTAPGKDFPGKALTDIFPNARITYGGNEGVRADELLNQQDLRLGLAMNKFLTRSGALDYKDQMAIYSAAEEGPAKNNPLVQYMASTLNVRQAYIASLFDEASKDRDMSDKVADDVRRAMSFSPSELATMKTADQLLVSKRGIGPDDNYSETRENYKNYAQAIALRKFVSSMGLESKIKPRMIEDYLAGPNGLSAEVRRHYQKLGEDFEEQLGGVITKGVKGITATYKPKNSYNAEALNDIFPENRGLVTPQLALLGGHESRVDQFGLVNGKFTIWDFKHSTSGDKALFMGQQASPQLQAYAGLFWAMANPAQAGGWKDKEEFEKAYKRHYGEEGGEKEFFKRAMTNFLMQSGGESAEKVSTKYAAHMDQWYDAIKAEGTGGVYYAALSGTSKENEPFMVVEPNGTQVNLSEISPASFGNFQQYTEADTRGLLAFSTKQAAVLSGLPSVKKLSEQIYGIIKQNKIAVDSSITQKLGDFSKGKFGELNVMQFGEALEVQKTAGGYMPRHIIDQQSSRSAADNIPLGGAVGGDSGGNRGGNRGGTGTDQYGPEPSGPNRGKETNDRINNDFKFRKKYIADEISRAEFAAAVEEYRQLSSPEGVEGVVKGDKKIFDVLIEGAGEDSPIKSTKTGFKVVGKEGVIDFNAALEYLPQVMDLYEKKQPIIARQMIDAYAQILSPSVKSFQTIEKGYNAAERLSLSPEEANRRKALKEIMDIGLVSDGKTIQHMKFAGTIFGKAESMKTEGIAAEANEKQMDLELVSNKYNFNKDYFQLLSSSVGDLTKKVEELTTATDKQKVATEDMTEKAKKHSKTLGQAQEEIVSKMGAFVGKYSGPHLEQARADANLARAALESQAKGESAYTEKQMLPILARGITGLKTLQSATSELAQIDSMITELAPGKHFAKGLREVFGGWGLMYLSRVFGWGATAYKKGYAEMQQYMVSGVAKANEILGYDADNLYAPYAYEQQASLLRNNGTMSEFFSSIGSNISADIKGSVGTGIGAYLGLTQIGSSLGGAQVGAAAMGGTAAAGASMIAAAGPIAAFTMAGLTMSSIYKNALNADETAIRAASNFDRKNISLDYTSLLFRDIVMDKKKFLKNSLNNFLYGSMSYEDFREETAGTYTGSYISTTYNLMRLKYGGLTAGDYAKLSDEEKRNVAFGAGGANIIPSLSPEAQRDAILAFANTAPDSEYANVPLVEMATALGAAPESTLALAQQAMQISGASFHGESEIGGLISYIQTVYSGEKNQVRLAKGLSIMGQLPASQLSEYNKDPKFMLAAADKLYSEIDLSNAGYFLKRAEYADFFRSYGQIVPNNINRYMSPLSPQALEQEEQNIMLLERKKNLYTGYTAMGLDARFFTDNNLVTPEAMSMEELRSSILSAQVSSFGADVTKTYAALENIKTVGGLYTQNSRFGIQNAFQQVGIDVTQEMQNFINSIAEENVPFASELSSQMVSIGADFKSFKAIGSLLKTPEQYSAFTGLLNQNPYQMAVASKAAYNVGQPGYAQVFGGTNVQMDWNMYGEMTGLGRFATSLMGPNSNPVANAISIWGPNFAQSPNALAATYGINKQTGEIYSSAGALQEALGNGAQVAQGASALGWRQSWLSYESSMASIGASFAQIALQEEYRPQFWAIEDAQRSLQFRQQEWAFAQQEKSAAMQTRQFEENIALQGRQMYAQRGWAQEDWAFQDLTRSLQWGWKQEDYEENVRFMSGRERKIAERGMERETTMFNLETGKIEEQRERQKEIWALEDERFALQKKHYEEQRQMQEESLKKQKEFYEEGKKLTLESVRLSREYQEKQLELQKAALGAQAYYITQQKKLDDDMRTFMENQELAAGEMSLLAEKPMEFTRKMISGFEIIYREWERLLAAIESGSGYTPIYTGKTDNGGYGDDNIEQEKAEGGDIFPGKRYVVGERGWEISRPSSIGSVVNQYDILASMSQQDKWSTRSVFYPSQSASSSSPQTINVYVGNEKLASFIINTVKQDLEVF